MHARNRTWLLGSDPVERFRQRTLPVEGGDGSTLSLDFTTGVLDPRLTFTRSTNATFINSQGLVEWANSNMYWNTAFEGLSGSNPSLTSSGWGYVLSTGGTAVFNGDGSVTVTTTAAERRAILRSSGFSGGGLRVVASVDVTIASGSLQAGQVIVTGTPTNAQHYVNGVAWNSLHPLWNGGILPVGTQFNIAYATDSLTSGTTSMYFGVGCSSVIAGSATFSNPRWTMWKGSGTVPYYPNTSATNNSTANYFKSNDYQAPRFDYDPSTLQPRGLLIEGTSSNIVYYSEGMATSGPPGWSGVNITRTASTGGTAPNGSSNTATKFRSTAAISASTEYIHTLLTGLTSGSTYTFSLWAKADGAEWIWVSFRYFGVDNGSFFQLTGDGVLGNTTGTLAGKSIVKYPNGWYRISISHVLTGSTLAYPFFIPCTSNGTGYASITGQTPNGVLCWGGQVELGSGASSYIPTGASTGSRVVDACFTTSISSWFTNGPGTIVAHSDNIRTNTRNLLAQISDGTANNYVQVGLAAVAASGEAIGTLVGGALQGFSQSASSPSLNTVYKSAYVWDTNYFRVCLNGTLSTADTTGTLATALDRLAIGTDVASSSPTDVYMKYGHIRLLKYWPTRLSDAQLQALTT